jgi:hypothetical protein
MSTIIPGHHFSKTSDDIVEFNYDDDSEYVCMRRKKESKTERKKRSREHQFVLIIVIIVALLVLGALWSRACKGILDCCTDENNWSANIILAIIVTLMFFVLIYFCETDDLL